jgi:hypothetical protein
METHKVKLAKGHLLIDAISQCVDFVHGKYAVRPTILKHNDMSLMRSVAFSSLNMSTQTHYAVQRIYGMEVKRSTKVSKDSVMICIQKGSEIIDVVQITVD